jgi:hypothetical protein
MRTRYCKNNPEHLILESARTDSIFCSSKCGWTYRNRRNELTKKNMQNNEPGLFRNHKILKDLVGRGLGDISKETAFVLGLDVNCYTGIINIDRVNKTTEFKLFEFSYTIDGDRIKIKKLNNGRI